MECGGDDPRRILDEHWYMTDYHVSREKYQDRPMYPLRGINVDATDYRQDASARGIDASVSLANDGDVHVGGTPDGRYLDGTLDFLRIAQGTLADADTTIEELYAWEFDGPFLRDFAGRKPIGTRRDAGAIDKAD
jgi:hypothetical protein